VPIRRDLRASYPPDWPAISRRIRFGRAGGRCEACGRPHGRLIYALPDGRWLDPADIALTDPLTWRDGHGAPVPWAPVAELMASMRVVRVVLTCAHRAHDPTLNDDGDLAAWCGRCHLIHDAAHHAAQRRITHRSRWAAADLFGGPYRPGVATLASLAACAMLAA
jgi:hypothetical protein